MKVELEFAELHSPLFLGGKNHQMKLVAGERTDLKLVYDRGEKELLVTWKDSNAIVPLSNVASMWPMKAVKAVKEEKPIDLTAATKPLKAQASSPTDHVFAGAGHGKSR